MNPSYDTVKGKPIKGAYRAATMQPISPALTTANYSEGISPFESINMALNNGGIVEKDPTWMSYDPEYAANGEYSTLDEFEDSYLSNTGKIMSRTVGKLVGRDQPLYDQYGKQIMVPYATTVDPYTGKVNDTPSAVELNQLGSTGAILDNIAKTKYAKSATGEFSFSNFPYQLNPWEDQRFEVKSVLSPKYDPELGWIFKESVGSGEELKKKRIAGESIINQYGPKSLSENPLKLFGKGVINTLTDLPRSIHSVGAAVGDLGEALANGVSGDGFESDYTRANAYSDYWRYLNQEQDFMARPTIQSEKDSIFDNWESFGAGLGSGVGSLLQYAALGRLIGTLDKAGALAKLPIGSTGSTIIASGIPLNFGEAYDSAKQAGLPLEDAATLGMVTGIINSYIEKGFGANVLEKYLVGGAGARNTARIIAEEVGGDVSKLANEAVKKNIMRKISSAVTKFAGSGVPGQMFEEGAEEVIQGMIKNSMEGMYDAFFSDSDVQGDGYFGTNPFSWDAIRQNLEEGVIGSILGGAGSIRAFSSEKKAQKEPSIAYVARNEEQALFDGAKEAFDSQAINENQYNTAIKDIKDLVTIRDNNKDLFAAVANYKPEYRGKVAESILESLDNHKSWIEDNADKSINKVSNYDDNTRKDYINELEDLAQSSIISTISFGKDSNGVEQTQNIPVSTLNSLIKSLRDSKKDTEADMIERSVKDATSKTSRIVKSSKKFIDTIDKNARDEARYRFLTDTKNSLTSLNLQKEFNRQRLSVLDNDNSQIISNSNNVNPGVLSDVHLNFQSEISDKYPDLTKTITEAYKDGVKSVEKVTDTINKIVDSYVDKNKAVSGIVDYGNTQKLIYKYFAENVMNDEDINDIMDNNSSESALNEYKKAVEKDREMETAGATENMEIGNKQSSEKLDNRIATEELNNYVDSNLTPQNTSINVDDVNANLVDDGKGNYKYTISDDKYGSKKGVVSADNIEDAIEQFKPILKQHLNDRVNKNISTSINVDKSRDVEVQYTESSDNVSNNISHVTSNFQVRQDSPMVDLLLHQHINDPLTSVTPFFNDGKFAVSTNYQELSKRNLNMGKAVSIFNSVNSAQEFNNLKEEQRRLVIDYLPIQYTFTFNVQNGQDTKQRIFITDRSSFGDKELNSAKYNTRKYIIEQLLSNNKEFSPNRIEFRRAPGKYNTVQKGSENRNSNVSTIRGLHIGTNKDGNYVHNYKIQGSSEISGKPVKIGIADSEGLVLYKDGKNVGIATGEGNPGNVYLILPAGLTMDRVEGRILKLNPRRITSDLTDKVTNLLFRISNGEISDTTLVKSDDALDIKVPENSLLQYGSLIDMIIPYGNHTIKYMNPEYQKDRDNQSLPNKTLWIDQSKNLIHYGYNEEYGVSNVLDTKNATESDIAAFKTWMSENKNLSVSRNAMELDKIPEFKFGEIESNGKQNYETFLIKNNIVQSDLIPEARSIIKNTVLYLNFPELKTKDVTNVNETKTVVSKKAEPIKNEENIVTEQKVPGKDLTDNVFNSNNYISDTMSNERVISFMENLPNDVVMYIAPDHNMKSLKALSKAERIDSLIDATEYLPVIKRAFRGLNTVDNRKRITDLYETFSDLLRRNLKLEEGLPIGIITFAKTDVLGKRVSTPVESSSDILNIIKDYGTNGPEINSNRIDWESSGLPDGIDGINKVKLVEIRGRNSSGKITGTVRVFTDNGNDTFEVFFNESDTEVQPEAESSSKVSQNASGKTSQTKISAKDTETVKPEPKPVSKEETERSIEEDFLRNMDKKSDRQLPTESQIDAAKRFFDSLPKIDDDSNKYLREITNIDDIKEEYKKLNKKAETDTYRNMLSKLTGGDITIQDKVLEILGTSGNVKYAWASMNLDGATVWEGAEEGSLYHEAFHRVSLLYLDQNERGMLYSEARKKFNMPSASNFSVEERLAEDFRKYMLGTREEDIIFDKLLGDSIKDVSDILEKYKLSDFDIMKHPDGIYLSYIQSDVLGSGSGTKALKDLIQWSSKKGVNIYLMPLSDRLSKYYKRLGFTNYDNFSETLVFKPKKQARLFSFISNTWNNLKNFIRSFLFNKKPSYTDLETLFNTIQKGGYKYVKPSKENIDLFKKRYPSVEIGMEVGGVQLDSIQTTKQFYDITKALTAITLNENGIEAMVGKSEKTLSFNQANNFVVNQGRRDSTALKNIEDNDVYKNASDEQKVYIKKSLYNRINVYQDILKNFDKVFVPAIKDRLNVLGWKSTELNLYLQDIENRSIFDGVRNDEIASSYEFSTKDTATADIRLLFETLRADDSFDNDTGMPNYTPYDIAWFDAFRTLHNSTSISNMLDRIKENADKLGGTNMYSSLYDKLTGTNASDMLKTRFWVTLKKHRHAFINTYYRNTNDGGVNYYIQDADINKRSKQLVRQWSTLFGLEGKHRNIASNIELIQNINKKWNYLRKEALRNTLGDVNYTISSIIDIFGGVNIDLDFKTVELLMQDYDTGDFVSGTKQAKLNQLRNFILDKNNINGDNHDLKYFFSKFLSKDDRDGVIGKDTRINPVTMKEETPESYLESNKFVTYFANKYIIANPSIEDDSILGPDGNNVYAYSEYNYLTQSVEEYFKDDDYLNKLKSSVYNSKSTWLDYLTNPNFNKNKVKVSTVLSFLQLDESDTGRDYTNISDVEDVMLKFNGVMQGKYPLPTLAGKRTYYMVDGIPTHSVDIIRNAATGNIGLDDGTIRLFTDYLKSEYLAINAAYDLRSKFLKDNDIKLEDFNNLSEEEQDKYDYSMLIQNYHYEVNKETGQIDISKGNGYKFRYFSSFDKLSRNELHQMFSNSNTANLMNYVSRDLIQEINDTIDFMSEIGVIEMKNTSISASTKSIGTDSKGEVVITKAPLIDTKSIDKYAKNKSLPKPSGSRVNSLAVLNMIADYAINTAISTIEFEKLVSFDKAFYKDNEDRIKRYSGLASTGLVLNTDWTDSIYGISPEDMKTYRSVILKSNVITTGVYYDKLMKDYVGDSKEDNGALFNLYRKFWTEVNSTPNPTRYLRFKDLTIDQVYDLARKDAEERLSGFKKVDQTDAQTYISPEMFRKINIMIGQWTKEKEAAYQLLESDKELTLEEELQAYNDVDFHVLKMVYMGPSFENGMAIPTYDKMSLATVFKRMAKGRDLEVLYNVMEDNNLQFLKFDTAVKAGNRQAIRVYDKQSQTILSDLDSKFSDPKYIHTQEFKFLRRQLVTDPHETGPMAAGTQMIKIGMAGVENGMTYNIKDTDVSGKQIINLNRSAIEELTRRGFDIFSDRFQKDGVIDKNKMVDLLRKNAIDSNQNNNLIDSFKVKPNGEYEIEPSLLPNMSWIQSRLLSTLKQDVVDTNLPGNAFVQLSNFGFKNSNIKVVDSGSYKVNGELAFRDPSNRLETIVSMSMIRPYLPKIVGNQIIDGEYEEREMTYEEAREYARNSDITSMGYRIPTQGQNSTVAVHIVDILPETVGDTVILPAEFTTLTGSDFDIDKLYMVGYNYYAGTNEDGKKSLNKVEYDLRTANQDISQLSDKQLQNLLIDTYISVLTSDNHLMETTTPLDATTKPIKDVVDIVEKFLDDDATSHNLRISFPRYQSDIKSQNVGAAAGIAPMALANVHNVLTTQADVKMDTNVPFGIEGKTPNITKYFNIGNLNNKYDKDGTLILDWTSALINAHVDAEKDPYILKLNVNRFTYGSVGLLIRSGFGIGTFYMMPQPILVDLANEFLRLSSGKLGLTNRELQDSNIMDTINKSVRTKYRNLYKSLTKKEGIKERSDRYTDGIMSNVSNSNWLLKQLETSPESRNANWYYNQLNILDAFDQINVYGRALSNMISKTQIDTAKYGKNATAISIYLNGIETMLDKTKTPYFVNAQDIFDKTFLGVKKQYSIDSFFDMFGSEFIELTPTFQKLTNSILKETGNYNYQTEQLVNTVNNAVKHSITAKFFDEYVKENNINTNKMFFGDRSTVAKYKALMKLANTNANFQDLKDNAFLNMLMPNSTDYATSLKTGKPQLFNTFVMKNKDADSVNQYVSGFRDILTHEVESVRNLGNELILYAYLTSGGTSGGINNIMNLVPYDILANLSYKDGTTYNDYMRGMLEVFNNDMRESDLNSYKDFIYKSLWNSNDIVPEIGISEPDSKGRLTVDNQDKFIRYVQNHYKNSGLMASPHIVMSPYFTKVYYNGTNIMGEHQFTPYIKVPNALNKNEYILYKYVGYISDPSGDEISAVYQLSNKLGYKDKQYVIKDISDRSLISENNKFNNGNHEVKFNNALLDYFGKGYSYSKVQSTITEHYQDALEVLNDSPVNDNGQTIYAEPSMNESKVEINSNEPISKQILDNSELIVAEFPSDKSKIESSFELSMFNAFNDINELEQTTSESVLNNIKDRNSSVMTSMLVTPSTIQEDSKPVAVIRNDSYIEQPISESLKRQINRLKEYGATFNVLSNDQILIAYMDSNNMTFNTLGSSVVSEEIQSNYVPNSLSFEELFPQLNDTLNKSDSAKILKWRKFVTDYFGYIDSYSIIPNEYAELSRQDRNEYEESSGNKGVNRFGGNNNIRIKFSNGIEYNFGDGIGNIINDPKTLSLEDIKNSGTFAFFGGTASLLKEKLELPFSEESLQDRKNQTLKYLDNVSDYLEVSKYIQEINKASTLDELSDIVQRICK